MAKCQSAGCELAPTRTVEVPAITPGLEPFVFDYCGEHADLVLSEPTIFPGATEVATSEKEQSA